MKVKINGKEEVVKGGTIMEVCEEAGIRIPKYCKKEGLKVAGNCRVCYVEVKGMPKLVASCSVAATTGMEIKTNSVKVKKGREGLTELILGNHPLDCPICDQGGECDLQDQSKDIGSELSRRRERRRGVEDKKIGVLVKGVMTRCIQCSRCVRYGEGYGGVWLGMTGRDGEVSKYVSKRGSRNERLGGNIIDLCPVGMLKT